jgi:toxin ParE1/3/4
MSRYVASKAALQDLDDIWEYIALDDPGAASRWIAKLTDALERLARTPGIGHKREDWTSLPLLFWPVGEYLIADRPHIDQIEVIAVTQGARHIPALLSARLGEQ